LYEHLAGKTIRRPAICIAHKPRPVQHSPSLFYNSRGKDYGIGLFFELGFCSSSAMLISKIAESESFRWGIWGETGFFKGEKGLFSQDSAGY
jgi:hypothetical protein